MNGFSTPPGWYADGEGWERRWDGAAWTDERREVPARPSAPPPPPSYAPPTWAPVHPAAQPGQPAPYGQPGQFAQPGPGGPAGPPMGSPPAQNAPAGGPPAYGRIPTAPVGFPGAPLSPPPGPPSPPKKKRGPVLWLVLGLGVLLIVGGGITAAVWKPWADKDSETPVKGGDPDQPAAEDLIRGDLDGDGLGDVKVVVRLSYDQTSVITAMSTGTSFDVTEVAGDPYTSENTLWVDWDGDGVAEDLTWKFDKDASTFSLDSSETGFRSRTPMDLSLSTLAKYEAIDVRVASGDFDGDGNVDVVLWGPNDRKVDVYVLNGNGAGEFDKPVQWASIPNALLDDADLVPGDLDGDGDDDLFASLPARKLKPKEYRDSSYFDPMGTAQLTSDGEKFSVSAVDAVDTYSTTYLVGNFGGDKDLVVSVRADSFDETLTVAASEILEGRLVPDSGPNFVDDKLGDRDLAGATFSDVDGDGDDDLVYLAKKYDQKQYKDFTVLINDGGTFQGSQEWGKISPCEDYCYLAFY